MMEFDTCSSIAWNPREPLRPRRLPSRFWLRGDRHGDLAENPSSTLPGCSAGVVLKMQHLLLAKLIFKDMEGRKH